MTVAPARRAAATIADVKSAGADAPLPRQQQPAADLPATTPVVGGDDVGGLQPLGPGRRPRRHALVLVPQVREPGVVQRQFERAAARELEGRVGLAAQPGDEVVVDLQALDAQRFERARRPGPR